MNITTRIHKAERVGRWLSRGWRGYVRGERQVTGWLTYKGFPVTAASVLLWTGKLILLVLLFYAAFWLTLLLVFAMAAAWVVSNAYSDETSEPEWRNGPAGFGLYTSDEFRIDPHVYDDD